MDDETDSLGGSFLPSTAVGSQGGLAIYEDTQFLPGIGGGEALLPSVLSGNGLMHEDTEFITRDIMWNRQA